MATLTIEQVARVALDSGWTGEAAAIATAIGMAESGGRTDARGDTTITNATWGPSIGIWQIRSLNSQKGTGGERDEIANLDPRTNGRHAFAISGGGTNWRPWSVYTNGRYRSFLPQARLAVGSPGSVDGNFSAGNPSQSSGGSGSLLTSGATWSRVGLYILGGLLVTVALYKATGAGNLVANVIPAGKALKAVKGLKALT